MDIKEKIEGLRAELHRHNYNYYVLNAPEISDKEFDEKIRELQDLEQAHPEYKDENSPTMRVGSDINKNFTQVAHKYPMLSHSKSQNLHSMLCEPDHKNLSLQLPNKYLPKIT